MFRKYSLVSLLILCQFCFGQDYQKEFSNYFPKDTVGQLKVLEKWQKAKPNDPELYTSYFNYYISKAKKEYITLVDKAPEGESLALKDSLGNTKGYFGSEIYYDSSSTNKGLEIIDKGIKLFPNRLDMRFGKTHILGEIKDWEKFSSEIVKAIKYSKLNNNNWTWTNNEKVPDEGEKFLLSNIQGYQYQIYNTGDDNLLRFMKLISEEILKLYPNHVESLSNLSVINLIDKKYDSALEYLLKAEKINPEDYIVLSNIARTYFLKNDINKSKEYYNKVIKYGNEDVKQFAKEQIKQLDKKSE